MTVFAGLSAGVAESILVVTPGEALKTRIVQDAASKGASTSRGITSTVSMIVREEGVFALWKGLGPVLCKQGTNSAVRFTSFGILQEQVKKRWPSADGKVASTLAIGAVSGVVTV